MISNGEDWPRLDLRVDDHADPLGELRRLGEVAAEAYLVVADHLPTRAAFSAGPPGTDLIGVETARRQKAGVPSRSHAWARDAGRA